MAVTESAKHDVYTYFEEAMGKERATTLMAMVSPTGWADVATKQDLVLLRTELKGEMHNLSATFHRALWTHTITTVTAGGVLMGIAVALAQLIG